MNDCPFTPINTWETIKRGPYVIIVAGTPCQRIQGMQGTPSFPEDALMIFRGMPPGTYFHTRNCIPLDIVPISSNGEVLAIWTVKSNRSGVGPAPYFTSKILEAPAGWFKKKNIRVGDYVPLFNV
jgi:uncharacterized membrane protein (UPF0127 family)